MTSAEVASLSKVC